MKCIGSFLGFTMTAISASAPSNSFHGQVSCIAFFSGDETILIPERAGIRYIPEFGFGQESILSGSVDFSLALNLAYHQSKISADAHRTTSTTAELYRSWLRWTNRRSEVRIGLQKINFGPARLLRTLQWFDRLDPRDPLQLTTGVSGALYRHYFSNNANIWVWGLLADKDPRMLEIIPSKSGTQEFGGRLQIPLGPGEVGVTAHRRRLDKEDVFNRIGIEVEQTSIPEYRLGLDGIWDVTLGIWCETSLTWRDFAGSPFDWQGLLSVGSDYTVGLGNGLLIMAEHLTSSVGDDPWDRDQSGDVSAVSVSYPLNFFDQIQSMTIYNWDRDLVFYYLSWQRTFDRWIVHTSFYISTSENLSALEPTLSGLSSQGFQLTFIWNH